MVILIFHQALADRAILAVVIYAVIDFGVALKVIRPEIERPFPACAEF